MKNLGLILLVVLFVVIVLIYAVNNNTYTEKFVAPTGHTGNILSIPGTDGIKQQIRCEDSGRLRNSKPMNYKIGDYQLMNLLYQDYNNEVFLNKRQPKKYPYRFSIWTR